MKPFHLKMVRFASFDGGDGLPVWHATHRYSNNEAWGKTPKQAYDSLVGQLRASRPRGELAMVKRGYDAEVERRQAEMEARQWRPLHRTIKQGHYGLGY